MKMLNVELNKPTNPTIYFNDLPPNSVVLGVTEGVVVGMFMRRKISEPRLVPTRYGYYFYYHDGTKSGTGPHITLKAAIEDAKDFKIQAVIIEEE